MPLPDLGTRQLPKTTPYACRKTLQLLLTSFATQFNKKTLGRRKKIEKFSKKKTFLEMNPRRNWWIREGFAQLVRTKKWEQSALSLGFRYREYQKRGIYLKKQKRENVQNLKSLTTKNQKAPEVDIPPRRFFKRVFSANTLTTKYGDLLLPSPHKERTVEHVSVPRVESMARSNGE